MQTLNIDHLSNNSNRVGIATDFDGTISKIKSDRLHVSVNNKIKEILPFLSNKFALTAIISGREVKQVANIVGVKGLLYIGNHGAEYLSPSNKYSVINEALNIAPKIENIYNQLKHEFSDFDLDFKIYSLSIHYRRHKNPCEAEKIIEEKLAQITDDSLKIHKGRMVFDISSKKISKGFAVEDLIKKNNLQYFVYAGDDRTDVDVFNKLIKLENNSNVESLRIAIRSGESPSQLLEKSNMVVDSVGQLNDIFRSLL